MIVVTGATGTIGQTLLGLLSERGARVKALSRHPPRDETRPGIEWAAADLADRTFLAEHFAGGERLFLLTGNVDDMVRLQKNALAAAQEAGVRHVVKLSALGASDHSKSVIGVWHYNVERSLRETDLDWTILRPHVFMQNLLDQRDTIQRDRRIYSPSGEARIPMIDTRDIAAVAATVLTQRGHEGKRYTLTGPEAISYREATDMLSKEIEVSLTYVPETDDEAWHRLRRAGVPPWHIGARLALAEYQRAGGGTSIITDTVEEITGQPPRTFRAFARDVAAPFLE